MQRKRVLTNGSFLVRQTEATGAGKGPRRSGSWQASAICCLDSSRRTPFFCRRDIYWLDFFRIGAYARPGARNEIEHLRHIKRTQVMRREPFC